MLKIILKNKNFAECITTICIQIWMNKSLLTADSVERLFYYSVFMSGSKYTVCTMTVQLEYINHYYFVVIFQKYFLLCWHYA